MQKKLGLNIQNILIQPFSQFPQPIMYLQLLMSLTFYVPLPSYHLLLLVLTLLPGFITYIQIGWSRSVQKQLGVHQVQMTANAYLPSYSMRFLSRVNKTVPWEKLNPPLSDSSEFP